MKPTALLFAALAMTGLAGKSEAASCTAFASNALSLSLGFMPCAPGDDKDDKSGNGDPSKWSVNKDGIFGGGWNLAETTRQMGSDFGPVDFATGSTSAGGTFRLAPGFWETHGSAMVVFDGSNSSKVSPETYVAFELKPNTYAYYTYVTPFLESGARGALSPSGIQSMTLYARPIPLPPAALLFLTALGGVGFLSRRRKG